MFLLASCDEFYMFQLIPNVYILSAFTEEKKTYS